MPSDELILSEGPTAIRSNAPIINLINSLAETSVPATVSNFAGTFVCNYLYYLALRDAEKRGYWSLFIHLPNELKDEEGKISSLEEGITGVRNTLKCLADLHR